MPSTRKQARTDATADELFDEGQERILSAAAEVFGTVGFQMATIQDIVALAGVSRPLFYRRFTDKTQPTRKRPTGSRRIGEIAAERGKAPARDARSTDRTFVALADLRRAHPDLDGDAALARVRRRGYAVKDREILADERVGGAPILSADGQPLAAMIVSGPTSRIAKGRLPEIGRALVRVTTGALSGAGDE